MWRTKKFGGMLLVTQFGSQCQASYQNRPKVQVCKKFDYVPVTKIKFICHGGVSRTVDQMSRKCMILTEMIII